MKKSLGSFVALNRRMFLLFGVVLCLAGFGIAAWQINAAGASQNENAQKNGEEQVSSGQPSATPVAAKSSGRVEGIFRGVITPTKSDISPPLRSMKPVAALKTAKRPNEERDIIPRTPEIPKELWKNDPVVQSFLGDREIPAPIVSFDGSPTNPAGVAPPDPNGDVGPNHVITMYNLQFQIFNKTGTSLFGPANTNTLFAGFGGACEIENPGDPIVLYDQLADRWLLSQFTAAGPTFFVCVAISTTSDPLGTYTRYAVPTGTNFPDYPKLGMWPDAYYISTREFSAAGPFAGVGAYALNRAQALAGNPAAQVISFLAPPTPDESTGDGLLPADLDGITPPPAGSPNYFVGTQDTNGPYTSPSDAINIWKFTANFTTPASSSFVLANTIPVGAFNSILALCGGTRACIPQSGTANRIDHLGYRQRPLFRLAYRNFGTHEALVTNQSVSGGSGPGGEVSGIRWWEIRSPNSSPTIFQEGTFSPGVTDGIHRWMGSIAMDGSGNMGMGYSASSSTMFPSIFYTGRLVNDPLGTMPQGEASFMNGTGSQTEGGNRWGDYTSMSVDPTDDCTFWHVNQYNPTTSTSGWRLRVGSFKFPTCGVPTGTLSGTVTNCATMAPISGANVTLTPGGYVGGSIGSGAYTVTAPGGNYTATATKAGWTSGAGATGPVTITNSANTVANYCLTPAAILDPTTTPSVPTGNGFVEPNECNSISLPVTNSGTGAATAVSAVLTTSTAGVTVSQPNSAYPDIAAGGTQTNTTPFQISTDNTVACFTNISLTLTVTFTGGTSPQVINFNVPVGQAANPNYAFTSTTGNTIPGVPANGVLVTGTQADDAVVAITAPFAFTVYGTTNVASGATLRVNTNGNMQITNAAGSSREANTALPSLGNTGFGSGSFDASTPVLMPYWDDLIMTTARSPLAGVYQQTIGVAPNRQWVVEWRAQHWNGGTAESGITTNFAIVFNEGSDNFEYYYASTGAGTHTGGATSTIGVQAATTGTLFTQYSLDAASVTPGTRLAAARVAGACAPGTGGCATAAGVEVSGRVLTSAGGRGLRGAVVTLRDESGNEITTPTGAMGNFRFADVEPGHTYVVTIRTRRFQYAPQVLTINDSITDLVFTPE